MIVITKIQCRLCVGAYVHESSHGITAVLECHMRGQLTSIFLSTGEAMRPLLCLQQVRLRTKYT